MVRFPRTSTRLSSSRPSAIAAPAPTQNASQRGETCAVACGLIGPVLASESPAEELEPLRNAAMPVLPLVDPVLPDVLLDDGARPEVPG